MGNRISKSLLILLTATLFTPAWALEKGSPKYNKDSAKEIAKKYGSHRPKETLIWKDEMPASDRIDLENKYFTISYPKCFKVEPTIEDYDDVTIKNSASLNFSRTNECKAFHKMGEYMSAYYNGNLDKETSAKFHTALPKSVEFVYAQFITVGNAFGFISAEVRPSGDLQAMYEPFLIWTVKLLCAGKENRQYILGFVSHRGEEVSKFLKKESFKIPEDYRQIISSFHCPKNN